jgi:hypothetical protein
MESSPDAYAREAADNAVRPGSFHGSDPGFPILLADIAREPDPPPHVVNQQHAAAAVRRHGGEPAVPVMQSKNKRRKTMVRKLLATTAIATLLASGAMAQSTPPPAQPAPSSPGMTMPADSQMVKKAEGHLASNLIGETVYNSAGDDADNIGEVNDLVIGPDGQV